MIKYFSKASLNGLLFFIGLALICSATHAQNVEANNKSQLLPPNQELVLRLPKEDFVGYQGLANQDSAGLGTGAMLYPGFGGLVGFLAAIATHGVINESSKNSQKNAIQTQADKVLIPYQDVIKGIKFTDLFKSSQNFLKTAKLKNAVDFDTLTNNWTLISSPTYMMTQDESALELHNLIAIYAPGKTDKPSYVKLLKAISKPLSSDNPRGTWLDSNGEEIKAVSARLLSNTLDMVYRDIRGEFDSSDQLPQKTYRYKRGKLDTFERATQLSDECDRLVLKTLRGDLLSIPKQADLDKENTILVDDCKDFKTGKSLDKVSTTS